MRKSKHGQCVIGSLRLMGKKLLVSLAMEEGDDLLMAMARQLVTEQHIGETADQVWAALQKEQAEVFGLRDKETPRERC